jgi:sugar phosphate isomerase/epimerase
MPLDRDDLVLCAGSVPRAPFLDRLAPARAAGFAALSMQPHEHEALRAAGTSDAELRRRLADHGLRVAELDAVTTWLPGQVPPAGLDRGLAARLLAYTPERLCPVAEAVGARSLSVVEFFGLAVDVDRAAEAFARVCDRAAGHGLLVHLEFLPWAGIPDLRSAWEIVRRAGRGNGGLLVDSWHLFRSGSTLAELGAIPGDFVLGVQIDDAPAAAEGDLAEETQHRRLLPGEGDFDLVGLVRTLDAIGSRAPIGVEVFSDSLAARPVGEIARRCAEAARRVVGAARAPAQAGASGESTERTRTRRTL